MENITYLLGAGASANALPLVLDIPQRLLVFSNYLRNHSGNYDVSNYSSDISDLYYSLSDHNTIDGYAISLFQNKVDKLNSHTKLKKLKSILCGLFTFEQLPKKHSVVENENEFEPAQKVRTTLDPRYRTFYGKVLNRNDGKLNNRINILSWNYDLQLEIGLESNVGFQYENLNEICEIFPHPSCNLIGDNHFGYFRKPQIVKINGTAGIFLKDSCFHNIYLNQREYFDDHIDTLLRIHKEVNRYVQYTPFINFAWEQNEHSEKAIEYARSIISQTRILVVIGYSFPDFNREVDKRIFANEQIREIYLQMPKDDFEDVKYRLNASVRDENKVFSKSSLNEFFVPKEL